jgi:hypothetical protein
MQTAFARLSDGNPTLDEYCAEDPPDRDHVRGVLRSGDGYLFDQETLELVSGPRAKDQAAVLTIVQMRGVLYRLRAQGVECEFIEIESAHPADPPHQSFSPADLLAAAQLFERYRRAIEVEVERYPHARAPLCGLSVDLSVARDLIADCALQVERYLSGTPGVPTAPLTNTPSEPPRT